MGNLLIGYIVMLLTRSRLPGAVGSRWVSGISENWYWYYLESRLSVAWKQEHNYITKYQPGRKKQWLEQTAFIALLGMEFKYV